MEKRRISNQVLAFILAEDADLESKHLISQSSQSVLFSKTQAFSFLQSHEAFSLSTELYAGGIRLLRLLIRLGYPHLAANTMDSIATVQVTWRLSPLLYPNH